MKIYCWNTPKKHTGFRVARAAFRKFSRSSSWKREKKGSVFIEKIRMYRIFVVIQDIHVTASIITLPLIPWWSLNMDTKKEGEMVIPCFSNSWNELRRQPLAQWRIYLALPLLAEKESWTASFFFQDYQDLGQYCFTGL